VLTLEYTDSSSTLSGGVAAVELGNTTGNESATADAVRIYPSATSYTYDLSGGDILDLSGGYEMTTAYNDITVWGAIALNKYHTDAAIRDRNPPRPEGQAVDTESIGNYGKRSLKTTSLEVNTDEMAEKYAQQLLAQLKKPRVIKTLQIPGTTTVPNKFEDLIRIVDDISDQGGLYWVRSLTYNFGSDGTYNVVMRCEEKFLE
jgi:hypothetical protein